MHQVGAETAARDVGQYALRALRHALRCTAMKSATAMITTLGEQNCFEHLRAARGARRQLYCADIERKRCRLWHIPMKSSRASKSTTLGVESPLFLSRWPSSR